MGPFGLLIVAVSALPVAAELLARWWIAHRSREYVFPPGLRLHMHPHPDIFPGVEPLVRLEINRDGERGTEIPRLRRGEKLYRVLVAGGSQAEGLFLDQHTTWPGVLHNLLQSPDALGMLGATHAYVGSIARSGVGSQGLALILGQVLPRYARLNLIVIIVGASDVVQWLEQGAPVVSTAVVHSPDVFRCHRESRFGWRPNDLALLELLRRLRRRWLRPVEVNEGAGSWVPKARAMRARAQELVTTTPDPAPMLDRFETNLQQAVQLAKEHADRVLVVQQPWLEEPYSPEETDRMWLGGAGQAWREDVDVYYSFSVVSRLMVLMTSRTARVADRLNVEQLDLMPVLNRSLETYYDCIHLTAGGARAVATAVASAVLRERPVMSEKLEDELAPPPAIERTTPRGFRRRAS